MNNKYWAILLEQTSLWLPTKNQHKAVGKFTMNMTECLQTEYVARTNMTLQEKVFIFCLLLFIFKCKISNTYYRVKLEQIQIRSQNLHLMYGSRYVCIGNLQHPMFNTCYTPQTWSGLMSICKCHQAYSLDLLMLPIIT